MAESPVSCPVCSQPAKGARGLATHFRHRREAGDEAHLHHALQLEEARWSGLIEGKDFVRCLVCGHRAETLARHLKAEHGISADQYREAYGKSVPIRSSALRDKRSVAISKRPIALGGKKTITCPSCLETWEGSKHLAEGTHDFRCGKCRSAAEDLKWAGKSEPDDFVECRVCGYRAENLTSHLQNAHPNLVGTYKTTYPGSFLVASASSIRDKTLIRGVPRSKEFGRKVSLGKLASGFSHTSDSRAKMSAIAIARDLQIHFSLEDLSPYKLKNGKVSLARASLGLGRCLNVIRRECVRLGLPYHRFTVSQDRFLGILSKILRCDYEGEWSSPRFINPKSGRRFKFDGYFPKFDLIAEYHGYQHYTFPSRYYKPSQEIAYEEMRYRDDEKRDQVLAAGFKYLEVREDEDWFDEGYLRERLVSLGILVV